MSIVSADEEAFVLAGGRSSRMGRDKALLDLNGAPLIEHALAKLRSLGFEPRIVGCRPDLERFAPVIEDRRPGCGPLGGIEAALAVSRAERNLFLPVDLPLLPVAFLEWMLTRARTTGAALTVPSLTGRPQPLCSVLCRGLLPQISAAIEKGSFRVMDALSGTSPASQERAEIDLFAVETIAPAQREWSYERPLHTWFQNLNCPQDLDGLRGTISGTTKDAISVSCEKLIERLAPERGLPLSNSNGHDPQGKLRARSNS
ncbi:MAG TPA: molybdenum cofactor guanylyltransferase [Acidisarcina sp.]